MRPLSRRNFLSSAVSYAAVQAAGERLRVGVIGCGGMANGHMQTLLKMKETDHVEIVAVCDIFEKRAQAAAQRTGGRIFKDYRTLLEDKNIDYVLIATPEHWHFEMTMDALQAGKHVYVEKPMTHTVEQAKRLAAKVRETGLKLQVGVQGTSDESYAKAYEYVQNGTLGAVVIAQIDYSRNYARDFWAYPLDKDARPGENFDWRAWLGPAPKRPWEPERAFRWRRYWDYSGGIATDLFVHRVTRLIKALNLTFPERGVGTGGKFCFTESQAEIPDTLNISLEYPGGPNVLLISSMANDTPVDHVLRGHKASLFFTKAGFTIKPQRTVAKDMEEISYQKTGAERLDLHHRNLHKAIRENQPLNCDAMLGYYGVVACEMGVQSFRKRKYMAWDKARERLAAL